MIILYVTGITSPHYSTIFYSQQVFALGNVKNSSPSKQRKDWKASISHKRNHFSSLFPNIKLIWKYKDFWSDFLKFLFPWTERGRGTLILNADVKCIILKTYMHDLKVFKYFEQECLFKKGVNSQEYSHIHVTEALDLFTCTINAAHVKNGWDFNHKITVAIMNFFLPDFFSLFLPIDAPDKFGRLTACSMHHPKMATTVNFFASIAKCTLISIKGVFALLLSPLASEVAVYYLNLFLHCF